MASHTVRQVRILLIQEFFYRLRNGNSTRWSKYPIYDIPRWHVVRQKPPLPARPSHIAQRVEHSPHILLPLRTVLAAKQNIR
jgi:hypothetical protein